MVEEENSEDGTAVVLVLMTGLGWPVVALGMDDGMID